MVHVFALASMTSPETKRAAFSGRHVQTFYARGDNCQWRHGTILRRESSP
jgi:hypothetical protein